MQPEVPLPLPLILPIHGESINWAINKSPVVTFWGNKPVQMAKVPLKLGKIGLLRTKRLINRVRALLIFSEFIKTNRPLQQSNDKIPCKRVPEKKTK